VGRHRSDPRGLARILIAAIAVVLALALLVVGGMALVNALTSSSNDPGGAGSAAPTSDPGGGEPRASAPTTPRSTRSAKTTGSSTVPLVIRVTGAPTQVYVRVTDTGDVLQQGVLTTGEARQYDQAPLAVVANNAGSLEVVIYGEAQARKPAGARGEWFVPDR
jgi:hypothetical protein